MSDRVAERQAPRRAPKRRSQGATRIIDMRNRPTFLHAFFGAEPGTPSYDVVGWLNKRVGSRDPDHFTRTPDLATYLREIEAAGITHAVMVGRSTPTVRVSNDTLADLARRSEGVLIGIASVDPLDLGRDGAVAEAKRAVRELGLRGINLDAGFYAEPMRADDERLMPLYEACEQLGVPAFVMSGPTTPDLAFNDPLALDRLAATFPKLPIVCSHGFYPNIDAILTVAFRHENVFVSPDMYTFAPGGGRYVEAANGFLRDQFLFGSSYPFRPMRQGVEDFRALGLSEAALQAAFWGNPARLFGMA